MQAERPLRVAITGSAGVGKTALAQALGRALGLPVIAEEMRAYLTQAGRRLETLSADETSRVLHELWSMRRASEAAHPSFVADNCTTDFAAYALQHGCGDQAAALLRDAALAARGYDAIFVLPWGALPYEADGVRGESHAAELRYQLILEGLLRQHVPSERLHFLPASTGSIPDPGFALSEVEGRASLLSSGLDTVDARVRFCLEVLARSRSGASRRGFVSLVGAGPGNPDLLTVRAAELLNRAEVVAYDALIPPAVLARIGPQAERILVGHRNQGALQAGYRLHPAVLELAAQGKHVVRLKQGDPFIFGRGGEEAEELLLAGIPFEVVPGVSAALGAAASAGIPLTHREFASDVSFATGHDIEGPRSKTNWEKLGAAGGTLVLYMATRKLAANLKRLIEAGRSAQTPAAYIAAATTPEQLVVTGTLEDLAGRVAEKNLIGPPALVIVGDVVRLRERLAGGAAPVMASPVRASPSL